MRLLRVFSGALVATVVAVLAVAPVASAVAAPVASVADVTVTEGSGGTSSATFTVTLSESNGTTTVTYATADGSAIAGRDYTATSGTLTFTQGQLQKTVAVPVTADLLDEADESFTFTLTSIDNGTFQGGDPNAVGTIVDDDAMPTLSIADATVTEGDAGTTTAIVTVALSAASGRDVSVEFATADGTASLEEGDYEHVSARVVFQPGERTRSLEVAVTGDISRERDEVFYVNLSNPIGATLADPRSRITIRDDDAPARSRTSLTIVKKSRSLVARGSVSPAHPGERMRVVLMKRRDGRFRTIAVDRPVLGEALDLGGDGVFESKYRTRFDRPGPGRCRIKAVFFGDRDHHGSVAALSFPC